MKFNHTLKIVTLLVLLGTMSCKKYLDVKSDDKLVVPKTLQDLQGLLDDAGIMNLRTTPSLGESSADDYFWLPATYQSQPITIQQMYTWIPVDFTFGNDWNLAYQAIYNSNLSLELLNGVERNGANALEWDNVKGSALFYRSFYFLSLMAQFAKAYNETTAGSDLGIVLKLNSDFAETSKRASVADCYSQLIADLELALPLLPNRPLITTRPSKVAVYALLARAYLYKGDYANALKAADEALKLQADLMNYNADASISNLTANVPFRKFNKETIFYTEMGTNITLHLTTRARIDSNLYASYHTSDLRKKAFFRLVNGYQQFKGSYAANATTLFSGLAVDEVLLTRAESYAYLGQVDLAMADLNELLKSRWDKAAVYLPLVANDKAMALQLVRTERRKELLMRNLRWMDVKRWNSEGAGIVLKRKVNGAEVLLQPNAAYYALPIPKDIILASGIPQN
ncbi:MAG: RagB/SusD family nutrient uptake outer membrane protein [Sphingobacteriales bacterium]|nr:MAG: RagB/SusD family nutrient uptake outer membrane protein [Sphingobacteriales bacterium]